MKKLLLLLILLTLTGCYNYRELNELAITTGIAIDKLNNEYIITAQVINTEKVNTNSDTSEHSKFIIYEGKGKNIQEAFRNITKNIPRRIYPNSIQIMIISDEIAYQGIYNILDLYFRRTEFGKQFYTIISKDTKAGEILKVITPLETLNSKKIKDNLRIDSNYYGLAEMITFEEMLDTYLDPNREISLPSIYIENNQKEGETIKNIEESNPNTILKLGPMAIFKNDKLIGYLNEKESIVLSFLKNEIVDSILTYECDKNKYTTIELSKIKSSAQIIKNKPKINIKINADGILSETQCIMNLEDPKVIEQINREANNELLETIKTSINNIIKNYNTDIFGFKDLYYKNNLNYYNQIKNNWYTDFFKNLDIESKIDIDLLYKGNTIKVINNEENK